MPFNRPSPIRLLVSLAVCAALALSACATPRTPRPQPVADLPPAQGALLAVDVHRLPEGVTWGDVESACAHGVREKGDIALTDRRQEPGAADRPCFSVRWLNGLPQRWQGCGELRYADQPRYRQFWLSGVLAAQALVAPSGVPSATAGVLAEVGWYDEAITYTEREWAWEWANRNAGIPGHLLEGAMKALPPDRQAALHDRLTEEALRHARAAQDAGDAEQKHRAAFKLVTLGRSVPRGSSAAAFVRRVRAQGVLDTRNLTKLVTNLRSTLVKERAYADALEGDPDPIGGFLDSSFAAGIATGTFSLFPSALIPAPGTATSAEKAAIKECTILMLDEELRLAGLQLYEALVGTGRTADAERLTRELKSRYPVKPIPQGDSPDDVVMRRLMQESLPPGDLDTRLRAAEERAKAATDP